MKKTVKKTILACINLGAAIALLLAPWGICTSLFATIAGASVGRMCWELADWTVEKMEKKKLATFECIKCGRLYEIDLQGLDSSKYTWHCPNCGEVMEVREHD